MSKKFTDTNIRAGNIQNYITSINGKHFEILVSKTELFCKMKSLQ